MTPFRLTSLLNATASFCYQVSAGGPLVVILMTQRLPTNEYALYAEMGFVSFVITVPLFIWNTTKEYNGSAIFDGLGGLVVWSLLWSLFYSPSVIDNVQRNFMVYILIFIAIQLSFLFIFKDRCKGKAANY